MRALKSFLISLLSIVIITIFCWLMFIFAPYSVVVLGGLVGFGFIWLAVYEVMI